MADVLMDDRQQFGAIMDVVRHIPPGHVMSYGQVGSEAGRISARVVGWAMANAEPDVPWHRVVASDGRLSIGRRDEALQNLQRSLLEQEGVSFLDNGCVELRRHQAGRQGPASQAEPQSAMTFDL